MLSNYRVHDLSLRLSVFVSVFWQHLGAAAGKWITLHPLRILGAQQRLEEVRLLGPDLELSGTKSLSSTSESIEGNTNPLINRLFLVSHLLTLTHSHLIHFLCEIYFLDALMHSRRSTAESRETLLHDKFLLIFREKWPLNLSRAQPPADQLQ